MPPQISVTVWSQRVCFIRMYMFITKILYSSLLFLFAYLTFILQITDASLLQTGFPHHPIYSFAVHLLSSFDSEHFTFISVYLNNLPLSDANLQTLWGGINSLFFFIIPDVVSAQETLGMNWAIPSLRGSDSYLYSHTWHMKTQLVKARNKSVSLGTFSFSIFLHVRLVCLANSKQG